MAPKVCVPMDFGRHLIGSPTHSNLTLNTCDGGEMRVSSVILSFNSPVIDYMTTTLHMTRVDMLEFSETSVQLFVDAAYSGTAEGLSRELFRDINKLANVFEMTWLAEKCAEYFTIVANSVKTPSYTELFYIFEEAAFVCENLKTNSFLKLVIARIEMLRWKEQFIEKYLENAERLSTRKLDLVIELAGTEVDCVVRALTDQLSNLLKVQGSSIPVFCEYLLDHSQLYLCQMSNVDLFDQLFAILKGFPDEKMRWMLNLYQKSTQKTLSLIHCPNATSVRKSGSTALYRCNAMPNLYSNFDMDMVFDQLLDWMSVSEEVTSLLIAVEAVLTWNCYRYFIMGTSYRINFPALTSRLTSMVVRRGWSLLPSEFSNHTLNLIGANGVWTTFDLTPFCLSRKETCSYVNIKCVDMCTDPLTLLSKESKLTFHFKHPSVTSCNLPGECGFILKTLPSEATLWAVGLCTEKEDYLDESVHFHNEIRAEEMHMHYCRVIDNNQRLFPFSWLGWLQSVNTVNMRDRWQKSFRIEQHSQFEVMYNINPCIKL